MEEQKKSSPEEQHTHREIKGMFEGPILPLLIRLALPIFGGMIFQLAYNITDTIWISRIDLADPSLVGGTGIVFPILFLAMAIGQGLVVGMSSLVARGIGEKNKELLGKVTESGLIIAVSVSVVLMVLFYALDDQIVRTLGATGDYAVHALEYLHYIIPTGAFIFIGMILNGILQGEGQMDKIMKVMIIGTIANIVLDPLFIFVFRMGVRGAGLATTLAQFLSVLYILSVFLRKKSVVHIEWKLSNIKLPIIGQIVSIGFPQAVGMATMAFSFLFFNRLVVSIDQMALTAFAICGRFEQAVLMPTFAISAALLTMTGQNAGRGNTERVHAIWRTSLLSAVIVVGFIATILVALAPKIYPFFSNIPDVVSYAVTQTRIMGYHFILAGIAIIGASLFQALGYPAPPLIITLLRLLGLAVPAAYLAVRLFDIGMYGVWGGIILGNVVGAAMAFLWGRKTIMKFKQGQLKVVTTRR